MPLKEPSMLIKRFYNGVLFKRGMKAFLLVEGEHLSFEDIRLISRHLGGINMRLGQGSRWNSLQNMLCKLGILTREYTKIKYRWNDELVPHEYKLALEMVRSGASIDDVVEQLTRQT